MHVHCVWSVKPREIESKRYRKKLRESLMCNMYVAALISTLLNNIVLVIFADNEKEEEMQIGYPTDVKHVAHIGADGPSANTPSWVGFLFIYLFFLYHVELKYFATKK